jgi:branched-chain amino acid transport system permease protein
LHVYVLIAAAILVLVSANGMNQYWMHVSIMAMVYSILASSWSLLAGYAGLFSLGHMAFASIGGYTSALLVKWFGIPIPLGIVAGIAMCCLLGAFIGWVCLRMSGPYLAIFTLGFSEIVRITFSTEDEVTGGMAGLHTQPLFEGASRLPYFYTAFALLAVALALMGLLVRSRWGLFLRALREDEQAAAASGGSLNPLMALGAAPRRELRRRIKASFEKNGIEPGNPNRVYVVDAPSASANPQN